MPGSGPSFGTPTVAACMALVAIAGAVFGGASAARAEAPTVVPPALLEADSEWYGLYIQDAKVGYLHRARRSVETDGTPLIELHDEFQLQAVVLGGERSTRVVDSMRFDASPPYLLRSADSETFQGDNRRLVRLVREGEGYRAEVCEAGDCRDHAIDLDSYTLAEALAPEVWVLTRPTAGEQIEATSLLLGELRASRDRLTLAGYRTTVLDGLPVEYADVAFEELETGLSGDLMITLDGRWLAGTLSGTFEVRLEPHKTAIQLDDTTDLFLSQAVAVDRPIGEPRELQRLTLAIDGISDLELPSTPLQSWTCSAAPRCQLSLGSGTEARPTDRHEVAGALETTVAFPADLPQIRTLALDATAGATDDSQKITKLAAWVADYIQDSYSAEPLSVSDLLADPRGDCTEHAALFITLARALGIPAREVHGLLYIGDAASAAGARGSEGGAFGGHAWAEVLIDGRWLEVDPTWNEIPPSVGHIRLGHRLGDSSARQAALAGRTLRVVEIESR